MSGAPRLLVIMGSGETSPTMIKAHRAIFGRLGPDARAVLLDTPFGFQENAADIAAKAIEYFAQSVGRTVTVASMRAADDAGPVEREQTLARVAEADWVFSGPGSPSYALRQWRGTEVPALLADKLRHGGCVLFASAAALTLGLATVPVYEIYKVGEEPRWLEGLDLLSAAGLRAAVIPHYDNAEGGNHDTRYCYLGERRLRIMEALLPEDAFVLGVDEHTGCILDLDAGSATVVGLGAVTVRRQGRSATVPAGSTVPVEALVDMAMARRAAAVAAVDQAVPPGPERSPLLDAIRDLEHTFDAAIGARDVPGAVRAILDLDDALVEWSRDTLQSDQMDRGRAALRRMVVKLGEVASTGARDPRAVIEGFVAALLDERASARAGRRFADADRVRDRLVGLGLEIRDTPSGTEWDLSG